MPRPIVRIVRKLAGLPGPGDNFWYEPIGAASATGIQVTATSALAFPAVFACVRVLYSLDLAEIPPERAVPAIAPRPILFIHGSDDPTIPVEHAYRLKAASKNPADELWVLEGSGHTEGVRLGDEQIEVSPLREEYLRRVSEFFDRSLR